MPMDQGTSVWRASDYRGKHGRTQNWLLLLLLWVDGVGLRDFALENVTVPC